MSWLRWFLLGLVLGLSSLATWRLVTTGAERVGFDFVSQVAAASVRRPSPEIFVVGDVSIGGVVRPGISVDQTSRIAWDVTLQDGARLEMFLGLREETWTMPGDGVLFRVGISYDGKYEELLTQVVAPQTTADDRRWVPISIDLAPFAGRQVSVIFNTGPGPQGNPADDRAVWGRPVLITRQ
jgi:hypothetical protein